MTSACPAVWCVPLFGGMLTSTLVVQFAPFVAVSSVKPLAVATATAGGAQTAKAGKPTATDVGVTAGEIHIAVVADVDNPFQPGLFQGVVDGVTGAAKYVNSKQGGGGVAGRKLVVDFIDSKLNGDETRNAIIKAC